MSNQVQSKGTKRDFSTAILGRQKAPNGLIVDEATDGSNSLVAMPPETLEKLQLSHGDTKRRRICVALAGDSCDAPEIRMNKVAKSSLFNSCPHVKMTLHLRDSTDFLNKVRRRFGNGNRLDVYRSFLKIMCMYGKKKKTVSEVYNEMLDLFYGHADLVQQFEGFWNDNTKEVLKEIKKIKITAEEDRRFEIDTLLSNITSAIERGEGILEGQKDCIERGLTPPQLRCFERLYDERGPEMIELLKENPQVVLARILPRLKQKQQELTRVRQLSNEFWAQLNKLRRKQ